MGNAVQCDVWCESEYDGEANSYSSQTEGHKPDSWQYVCISAVKRFILINRIKNKSLFTLYMSVYFLYLSCIYKYKHKHVYI